MTASVTSGMQRAEQHEPGERRGDPLAALVEQQVGGEHDVDADDEHQLGGERVPVDRRPDEVARLGEQ